MTDEEKIREMVRRVVHRAVGRPPPPRSARGPALVTEPCIQDAPPGEEFVVPDGALVTPLARQAAMERKISLVEGGDRAPSGGDHELGSKTAARGSETAARGARTVAIGADHGGYDLKQMLKARLQELGYEVLDCGTEGAESVDYPDFALAVAQLVAQGRAWRGILVDGAGIGSCMAANKVPGVRAALCYDAATAVNSRAHNDANVLTLGAGMIGPELGRQIVETWLETPAGGGRHARRVEKIMEIERRFLRGGR
jgi:ribose 5-phosphate isomerase B